MRKKFFAFVTGAMIAGTAAGQASAASYEVQPGDTLWSISNEQGTSIDQLKSWNNLSGDIIIPNQQLHIDGEGTEAEQKVYIVKDGDSLWKISSQYNVSVDQLMNWNKLNSSLIHPGQQLSVSGSSQATAAQAPAAEQKAAPAEPVKAASEPAQETQAAPKPAPAPQQQEQTSDASGKQLTVEATAYTANCNGCSGVTATGIDLKANPGQKIIAVDPSVIPLGSKVHVEGYGTAIAGDTGGAIKGNRIDVFVPSHSDAVNFGRKTVNVTVLN